MITKINFSTLIDEAQKEINPILNSLDNL